MKKLLFLILAAIVPTMASAQIMAKKSLPKKKYSVRLIQNNDTIEQYCDSLISAKVSMDYSLDYLFLELCNKTDHRIVIEWDNMRIGGSHIAFGSDRIFEMNRPRADEVLTSFAIIFKHLYKRYSTAIPIVDSKRLKKEGPQILYLDIPIRVGDKTYDISTKWIVERIAKK